MKTKNSFDKSDWEKLKNEPPEWFRDAKFGLFFHWGPYCVPACENEWYSRNMYAKGLSQNKYHVENYGQLKDFGYKDFYTMFRGENFDPEAWAELALRAGAKYAGPVTEHADNFSMWDSQVNPVNSVTHGPGRDVTGECAAALRKRGIKVLSTFHHQWLWGWFMSTDNEADVYDPANEKYYWEALPLETNRYAPYRLPDDKFNQMWYAKVREVIDKYKPDAIYFDSRTNIIDENTRYGIAEYYYNQAGKSQTSDNQKGKSQTGINLTGKSQTNISQTDISQTGNINNSNSCEVYEPIITYKQEDFPQDIGVYDIECGRFATAKPYAWQTDDRLEDQITWCIVQNPKYKSARTIIHQLCDVTAKNGNLLLNVGPKADGTFAEEATKELYAIGDWLKINGEAIYGTRPYRIAGEGPSTITDDNYDIERIQQQTERGLAADVRSNELTSKDIRFTQKKSANSSESSFIYAILMGWPGENTEIATAGEILVSSITSNNNEKIRSAQMLGIQDKLDFRQTEQGTYVTLPNTKPCDHAYTIKFEV
ncbi:MAG: alpha-L-fucosidase [Clostridiales bacterium]|jgi:alpha-L-fucosidase|nr:alpha-L-fucosidase [Clostridiales bacterium]